MHVAYASRTPHVCSMNRAIIFAFARDVMRAFWIGVQSAERTSRDGCQYISAEEVRFSVTHFLPNERNTGHVASRARTCAPPNDPFEMEA